MDSQFRKGWFVVAAVVGVLLSLSYRNMTAERPERLVSEPLTPSSGRIEERTQVAASAPDEPEVLPIFKTTPQALWALYEENEVAADDAMKGHAIEITGKVLAIDKDFTGAVVLRFAMQRETYGLDPRATMYDTPDVLARAAKLKRGDSVTIWCARMQRLATMPFGSKCHFKPDDPNALPVKRQAK